MVAKFADFCQKDYFSQKLNCLGPLAMFPFWEPLFPKTKKRGDFLPTNSMNFFLKHPLPTKHWRLTQVDINLSQRMLQEEGYENLESGISASRSYFSFLFRQRCFCSFLSSQLRLVQIFRRWFSKHYTGQLNWRYWRRWYVLLRWNGME